MSTYEYYDLCEKAQNNKKSKYHVFVFDIIGSKNMNREERCTAQYMMEKLMLKIYSELKKIEQIENKKILLSEDVVCYEERDKVKSKFGLLYEPFLFADNFGFTVYSGSISDEEILGIYNKCKIELGIELDFHINDLYYETNDYKEGCALFFRGYAIDMASTMHKDDVKIRVKKYK